MASPRELLIAVVVIGGALLVGRAVVPIPGGFGGLVGVLAGAFLLGLRGGPRRYVEVGVAGGLAAGVTALLDFFVLTLLAGIGLPVVAIGAGAGALAAVLGCYLGRDLRDGLTRPIG